MDEIKTGSTATFLVVLLLLCFAVAASAQKSEHYNSPLYSPKTYDPSQTEPNGLPAALQNVGIDQKLGDPLPLDSQFKDENGQMVKLGDYFVKGRPVVLALVYYECPMLCSQVLNGMVGSLKGMSFDAGKEYEVVVISFDTRENDKPDLAKEKKANYLESYGRPGDADGFHFLTGTQDSIDAVTKAAGYNYHWDDRSGQFAHAGGIMVVTPDGKMSRYFFGIDYAPKDLKLSIQESADNKVGDPVDRLLLYCYHYDPATGKYGLAILRVIRGFAVATLIGLGAMFYVFWRRNKAKAA